MSMEIVQDRLRSHAVRPARDWLSRTELAALTPEGLAESMRQLGPMVSSHADEAERLRRPADAVWSELRRSGIFYHFVPKIFGGLEFDASAMIDIVLPLAQACASTGWVAGFCMEHNWLLAHFPMEAQSEIFGQYPYIIAPGVSMPPGKAVAAPGGYRVGGRWKWGTGVMHADWVLASAVIESEEAAGPAFFILPIDDVSIIDTWLVDGMIATGSNDIEIRDAFVPSHRMVNLQQMRDGASPGARTHENPLYRMPMGPFLALTAAAPAVGAARGAIDAYRANLMARVVYASDVKYLEKPAAQMRLALADMEAQTAEHLVRDVAKRLKTLSARTTPATVNERVALRMQLAYATDRARSAIRHVCEAAGASAHFQQNPLQRAQRDVHVMASHVVLDLDGASEVRGRSMLGLSVNVPLA